MPRYLGIDHGTKRIGLALGDTDQGLAAPLKTLLAGQTPQAQAKSVVEVAGEFDIDAIVVGLPVNMDGSEGGQAKLVRQFGAELANVTELPVLFFDERLSSRAAGELLIDADLSRKKKKRRIDSVAAQVMLQAYLDDQRS